MPLPARFAPVLLTVGDPTDTTGWVYSLESVVGVIEQPTSNVNLIPLITPAKNGYGLFDHRVFEIGDPDIIIDGDTISIETPPLFPNVMASDTTRQVGGAYRYTVTLRAEADPRRTSWTYDFRFIVDGDASYTLVGTAIPVAQVSSIDPVDPLNPEWVSLVSRVTALEATGGGDALEEYNTSVATYGPIDQQIATTRTLQNATQVPSATLYTFTRTAVYDIHVYGRSTPGNGATGDGTAFVQVLIDGVEEVLMLHQQSAGSMAIHGLKCDISVTSGALLTFADGWYGAGALAELNWEITIRERPPWA